MVRDNFQGKGMGYNLKYDKHRVSPSIFIFTFQREVLKSFHSEWDSTCTSGGVAVERDMAKSNFGEKATVKNQQM